MFRNFIDCVDNHKKNLIDLYDTDIYLSLWDVYGKHRDSLRVDWYDDDIVRKEDIRKIKKILNPKKMFIESFEKKEKYFTDMGLSLSIHDHFPYPKNILSMTYKIKSCHNLMSKISTNYNFVVRMRTDNLFSGPVEITPDLEKNNTLYTCLNNSWSENTVCDVFGFGNFQTMDMYKDWYDSIPSIFSRVGPIQSPELLLHHHLIKYGIEIVKPNLLVHVYGKVCS